MAAAGDDAGGPALHAYGESISGLSAPGGSVLFGARSVPARTLSPAKRVRRLRLQGPPLRAWSGIRSFLALQVREHPIEVEIEFSGVGLAPFVDLFDDFILRLPGRVP